MIFVSRKKYKRCKRQLEDVQLLELSMALMNFVKRTICLCRLI